MEVLITCCTRNSLSFPKLIFIGAATSATMTELQRSTQFREVRLLAVNAQEPLPTVYITDTSISRRQHHVAITHRRIGSVYDTAVATPASHRHLDAGKWLSLPGDRMYAEPVPPMMQNATVASASRGGGQTSRRGARVAHGHGND